MLNQRGAHPTGGRRVPELREGALGRRLRDDRVGGRLDPEQEVLVGGGVGRARHGLDLLVVAQLVEPRHAWTAHTTAPVRIVLPLKFILGFCTFCECNTNIAIMQHGTYL